MKTRLIRSALFTLTMVVLSGCSLFGVRSGYEHLSYKELDNVGDVEIRLYPDRHAVEVRDAASDDEAFRRLFRYISGENSSSRKIAMTAPVEVADGEKISMTAPVEVSEPYSGSVGMRFFLPSDYTVENAPKPVDPGIQLVKIPKMTLGVLRYSGQSEAKNFREASRKLMSALEPSRWAAVDQPRFLGYDPPFTIPFLRRNEVIVQVKEK